MGGKQRGSKVREQRLGRSNLGTLAVTAVILKKPFKETEEKAQAPFKETQEKNPHSAAIRPYM